MSTADDIHINPVMKRYGEHMNSLLLHNSTIGGHNRKLPSKLPHPMRCNSLFVTYDPFMHSLPVTLQRVMWIGVSACRSSVDAGRLHVKLVIHGMTWHMDKVYICVMALTINTTPCDQQRMCYSTLRVSEILFVLHCLVSKAKLGSYHSMSLY